MKDFVEQKISLTGFDGTIKTKNWKNFQAYF